MKLQQYLLREAKVKTTNADIFLDDFVPVFMWNPKEGFLWAVFNKKSEKWNCYHGSRLIGKMNQSSYITHYELLEVYDKDLSTTDDDSNDLFITGRVSPDGKTIYVHNMDTRDYITSLSKNYRKYVNKTVDYVYRYMKDYIK